MQVQVFVPEASMPHGTQQSWVQGLPQLPLWQSSAQAPPGAESGFASVQVQLPGNVVHNGPDAPPVPPPVEPPTPAPGVPPIPAPVVPPEPEVVEADEHAKKTKLCATSAATPRFLN